MHSEQGATLVTAVNTSVWDQGISTRMCMFRDWARKDGKLVPIFLAGVQKVEGKANTDGPSHIAAFDVHSVRCPDAHGPSLPAARLVPISNSGCARPASQTRNTIPLAFPSDPLSPAKPAGTKESWDSPISRYRTARMTRTMDGQTMTRARYRHRRRSGRAARTPSSVKTSARLTTNMRVAARIQAHQKTMINYR